MRTVRDRLLQRCLAVLLNDLVSASETGAHCDLAEHGRVLTVPRIVLYASDQPEERHVLGLQGNRCAYPCSACMTTPDKMGSRRSQCAPRCPLTNLELQMEGTLLVDSGGGRQRLAHITQQTSALPFLPVLGAMHGLGTGQMALYQVFGFDLLHVSILFSPCGGRPLWPGACLHHAHLCHHFAATVSGSAREGHPKTGEHGGSRAATDANRRRVESRGPFLLVFISFGPSQVMKLGVLRLLGWKIPALLMLLCGKGKAFRGSVTDTIKVMNDRLNYLGRLCLASKAPPGYVAATSPSYSSQRIEGVLDLR